MTDLRHFDGPTGRTHSAIVAGDRPISVQHDSDTVGTQLLQDLEGRILRGESAWERDGREFNSR